MEANFSAHALPIPEVAPVIKIIRFIILSSLFVRKVRIKTLLNKKALASGGLLKKVEFILKVVSHS
jgi:hypothetical protein